MDGLNGARALALSDDGLHLYVAGAGDNAVAVFAATRRPARSPSSRRIIDGVAGADGLAGASGVAVSAGRRARLRLRRDRLGCRGPGAQSGHRRALTPLPAGCRRRRWRRRSRRCARGRRLAGRRSGLRCRRRRGCAGAAPARRRFALHGERFRLDRRHGRHHRRRLGDLHALGRALPGGHRHAAQHGPGHRARRT